MADRSKEGNIWPGLLVSLLVGFIFFGNYIFDYFGINLTENNISEEDKKESPLGEIKSTNKAEGGSDSKDSVVSKDQNSNETLQKVEIVKDNESENIAVIKEEIETRLPEIGFIRVEKDGSGIVSGDGEPGSTVSILLNDKFVTKGIISEDGQFALFFELPEFNKPFQLSLEQKSLNGLINNSMQSVLINPVIKNDEADESLKTADTNKNLSKEVEDITVGKDATVNQDTATSVSAEKAIDNTDEVVLSTTEETESIISENKISAVVKDKEVAKDKEVSSQSSNGMTISQEKTITSKKIVSDSGSVDTTTGQEELTKIPTIVIIDNKKIDVVQVPKVSSEKSTESDSLGIEVIAYDDEGEVTISGKGGVGDFVRIYIDDKPVKSTSVGLDGSWVTPLTGLKQGLYTLRADELSSDGTVVGRVETPFQRESISLAAKGASAITVQPGYTLWAIARERYGSGFQYVRVYQANLDLIKDPDLIYPGQVFNLPEE
ncbi:MAG: LysM peptidoglycan-binding domain-containing protein [Paracoccaceae bacterium]